MIEEDVADLLKRVEHLETYMANECEYCELKIYKDDGKWRHHASNFTECFGGLETSAKPRC